MKDDNPEFRIRTLAVILLIGAILSSGCGRNNNTIKIGAIFSVTGPASYLGDPEKKTIEMLQDELNKKGGVIGKQVEFIIEDDGGEESRTKNAAVKLIGKDQVVAIVGPSRSGNTMAILDLVKDKKIPLVSCALAEDIVEPVREWVFKTPQRDRDVADNILMQLNRDGIADIAVMLEKTSFGQGGLKQLEAIAPKYNVRIAYKGEFAPKANGSELETLLTSIKGNPAVKAIVVWSATDAQSMIPQKMEALGMSGMPLFFSQGFGNVKYVKSAGSSAEGALFPGGRLLIADQLQDSDRQKKTLLEYKKQYEDRYKEDVSVFGGHAWDAFWIVVKAIESTKSTDPAKLREAIENTNNLVGVDGIYNFTKQDHNGLGIDSLVLLQVKNGRFAMFQK